MIQFGWSRWYENIHNEYEENVPSCHDKRKPLIFWFCLPWILAAMFAASTATLLLRLGKLSPNFKAVGYLGWETDFGKTCSDTECQG
jgi:hypothetical protein